MSNSSDLTPGESTDDGWDKVFSTVEAMMADSAVTEGAGTTLIDQLKQLRLEKETLIKDLKSENEELVLRVKMQGMESTLSDLINKAYPIVKMNEWNIDDILISDYQKKLSFDTLEDIQSYVQVFNNEWTDKITEQSHSINDGSSVHNFWHHVFNALIKKKTIPIEIEYEWKVQHPQTPDGFSSIDFAFLPAHPPDANFEWEDFNGGIELKKSPMKVKEKNVTEAPGLVATDGCIQAAQRAAMCVFARWKKTNQANHRSFCFFADSRRIGVVRVVIDEDFSVSVDKLGPFDLPGFGDWLIFEKSDRENIGVHVLQLLAKVLHSPPGSLEMLSK